MLRRQLFAATGAVGALATAAALLPATRRLAPEAGDAVVPAADRPRGYALSPHVLRYYQTTRI
jgi:hypothetical protein